MKGKESDHCGLISVHGGHSGQFCTHARDTLEEIVRDYIRQGFATVAVTEHAPAASNDFLYDDDRQCGMDAAAQWQRFGDYMTECRRLQKKYAGQITLLAGMETETHSGSLEFTERAVATFRPDCLVGSVHHAADINFDYSPQEYHRAAEACGGMEGLYCAYFDAQHEMIARLKPETVGHFDLIRLFDPDYRTRLQLPEVSRRIQRNLQQIADLGLTLDYNQRALQKGADEPYISAPILQQAIEQGITILPGDDSHGVADCGRGVPQALARLAAMGALSPGAPATSSTAH